MNEKLEQHHGGITVHDGGVYCAVSECKQAGTKRHWIKVYNCDSLQLIASHDVGQHFTVCAGGIAYRKGHFFVAESFFDDEHFDRIVEFDSSFRHIHTHQVNFRSPYGIQGLEYCERAINFKFIHTVMIFIGSIPSSNLSQFGWARPTMSCKTLHF